MNYKFELLQELCTICKENHIKYFLYGTLMQAAYSHGNVNAKWDSYDIAVTGTGFRKLQEIVSSESFASSHPHRALESLLTNPHFPGFYANYVATDTLRFDFREGYHWFQNKGLPIHILIIANKGPDNKKTKLLRRLRKIYIKIVHRRPRKFKDRVSFGIYKIAFAIGGSYFKQKLFNNYLNNWKSYSKSSGLYLTDGRYITCKGHFWEKELEKTLGDVPFSVPQICTRKIVPQRYYTLNVIRSDSISFDEFLKLCRAQNVNLKEVYNRKKRKGNMQAQLRRGRKSKRYYNAAFYGTMIRHEISRGVDQCENKTLDSPEYHEIIEKYLKYINKHTKYGITPYVTLGIYLDAMKIFLENNKNRNNTREQAIYNIMLRVSRRIPDHYFLKSPIIPDSCYSAEEIDKDPKQLRAELETRLHELVWGDDSQDSSDSEQGGEDDKTVQ